VKVEFNKSFVKDLKNIGDRHVLGQVKEAISRVEDARSLQEVNNLAALGGEKGYLRLRIGDYRIGLKQEEDVIVFVRVLHRKEIYRYFP
jgi:mRNA interferase RelE/StbE